jgi:hypothetical protein
VFDLAQHEGVRDRRVVAHQIGDMRHGSASLQPAQPPG